MINIAELLKDAPKDLKLYSPICGHCKLSCILHDDGIRVIAHDVPFRFDKYGRFCSADDAECLIFPSDDCRTWEEWELPLKAGDVVMFVVNNKLYLIGNNGKTFDVTGKENKSICGSCKRVTLEEEQNFFAQLCLNGYTWDADKKELRKTIKPKFKVGDEVVWTEPKGDKPAEPVKIMRLIDKDQLYMVDMPNGVGYIHYDMQDYYKLVQKSQHYDISNFHAGMPVLVRETNLNAWQYVHFSHCYVGGDGLTRFNAGLVGFTQCIPFEGNEHLLGTTDPCGEEFINW